MLSQLDYPILKQFLSKPKYRVNGVDYERLDARLERRNLGLVDCLWVKDLLQIHAFLNQW